MAGTLYDYLAAKTPDYATTALALSPNDILYEEGDFNQEINKADDRSVISVVTVGSAPEFHVRLFWKHITDSEADAIFDLYFTASKANGLARTFKWNHPTDGHIYVVRFTGPLKRSRTAGLVGRQSYDELRLRIEGYVS